MCKCNICFCAPLETYSGGKTIINIYHIESGNRAISTYFYLGYAPQFTLYVGLAESWGFPGRCFVHDVGRLLDETVLAYCCLWYEPLDRGILCLCWWLNSCLDTISLSCFIVIISGVINWFSCAEILKKLSNEAKHHDHAAIGKGAIVMREYCFRNNKNYVQNHNAHFVVKDTGILP